MAVIWRIRLALLRGAPPGVASAGAGVGAASRPARPPGLGPSELKRGRLLWPASSSAAASTSCLRMRPAHARAPATAATGTRGATKAVGTLAAASARAPRPYGRPLVPKGWSTPRQGSTSLRRLTVHSAWGRAGASASRTYSPRLSRRSSREGARGFKLQGPSPGAAPAAKGRAHSSARAAHLRGTTQKASRNPPDHRHQDPRILQATAQLTQTHEST